MKTSQRTQNNLKNSLLFSWMALLVAVAMISGCAEGDMPVINEEAPAQQPVNFKEGADNIDEAPAEEPAFDEETCSYDAEDAFEPRTRFAYGPWEGECHDTLKRRPVIQLTPEEAESYSIPEGYLTLANVYHKDAFWVAAVPVDTIQDIYFQLEYFPAIVPAGHTQMRVDFKIPVLLYGQSTSVVGEYEETQQLVLSAEAVTRRGDKYDLFRGTKNHFAIALRVTTLEARYDSMIAEKGHHVEQWRLLLSGIEREKIFRWYVADSEALGLDEAYHTIFRNCTTELIRILDEVVEYTKGEQVRRFFLRVTEFYPNIVRGALIARGLLPFNQSTDWYALEDDPVTESYRSSTDDEEDVDSIENENDELADEEDMEDLDEAEDIAEGDDN